MHVRVSVPDAKDCSFLLILLLCGEVFQEADEAIVFGGFDDDFDFLDDGGGWAGWVDGFDDATGGCGGRGAFLGAFRAGVGGLGDARGGFGVGAPSGLFGFLLRFEVFGGELGVGCGLGFGVFGGFGVLWGFGLFGGFGLGGGFGA